MTVHDANAHFTATKDKIQTDIFHSKDHEFWVLLFDFLPQDFTFKVGTTYSRHYVDS